MGLKTWAGEEAGVDESNIVHVSRILTYMHAHPKVEALRIWFYANFEVVQVWLSFGWVRM